MAPFAIRIERRAVPCNCMNSTNDQRGAKYWDVVKVRKFSNIKFKFRVVGHSRHLCLLLPGQPDCLPALGQARLLLDGRLHLELVLLELPLLGPLLLLSGDLGGATLVLQRQNLQRDRFGFIWALPRRASLLNSCGKI